MVSTIDVTTSYLFKYNLIEYESWGGETTQNTWETIDDFCFQQKNLRDWNLYKLKEPFSNMVGKKLHKKTMYVLLGVAPFRVKIGFLIPCDGAWKGAKDRRCISIICIEFLFP